MEYISVLVDLWLVLDLDLPVNMQQIMLLYFSQHMKFLYLQ